MSQTDLLYSLLKDGKDHDTLEILEKVYGGSHLGIARISARVYDIENKYDVKIESRKDKVKKTIWIYRLVSNEVSSNTCPIDPPQTNQSAQDGLFHEEQVNGRIYFS